MTEEQAARYGLVHAFVLDGEGGARPLAFAELAGLTLVEPQSLWLHWDRSHPLAQQWLQAGDATRDPLWRMPLWRPYLRYLNSGIADLANSGSRMAGSVTAALYLERFINDGQVWAHLDVYAWNDGERPGRPAGGEALALRSAWAMLKARYA